MCLFAWLDDDVFIEAKESAKKIEYSIGAAIGGEAINGTGIKNRDPDIVGQLAIWIFVISYNAVFDAVALINYNTIIWGDAGILVIAKPIDAYYVYLHVRV